MVKFVYHLKTTNMKTILSAEVKAIKSAESLLIAMQNKTLVVHSNVDFGNQNLPLRRENTTLDYLHEFKVVNDTILYLPIAVNYGISGYSLDILNKYFTNNSFANKVNLNEVYDYFITLKKKGYFVEFRESDIFDESIQTSILNLVVNYKELFNITEGTQKHYKAKKVTSNIIGVDVYGSSWSPKTIFTVGDGINFTAIAFEQTDYRPIFFSNANYNQRPAQTFAVSKKILQKFTADCTEWKNNFDNLQKELVKVMRSVYIAK